jgi:hypothetical protein
MHNANIPTPLRRSSRVPITVPIRVTSLSPAAQFSEMCETLVVSAHGCAMRSSVRLDTGVPVRFQSKEGRQTTALVVYCQPMGPDQPGWRLGARLDRPENFWGLKTCPQDWVRSSQISGPAVNHLPAKRTAKVEVIDQPQTQVALSAKAGVAKEQLKAMVAELIQPLQTELTEFRESMARGENKRSRFEVSLSHIPPELQEQLWTRLRQDLGTLVVRQTREHADQVLAAAQATIEEKVASARDGFRQNLAEELRSVEQRAQSLTETAVESMRQHLRSGIGTFQQHVSDAANSLDQKSEELFQSSQQRLGERHDAYCREMREVQSAVAAQSSRLQAQIADLGGRIAKLDEFARRLESDLDARLARVASDMVADAQTQLENATESMVKQLATRSAKELSDQLDDACGKLKTMQNGIEVSVAESLKTEVADTLQSFEQTVEELAQHSVGRWRLALAREFNSLVKMLGQQLRVEAGSDGDETQLLK